MKSKMCTYALKFQPDHYCVFVLYPLLSLCHTTLGKCLEPAYRVHSSHVMYMHHNNSTYGVNTLYGPARIRARVAYRRAWGPCYPGPILYRRRTTTPTSCFLQGTLSQQSNCAICSISILDSWLSSQSCWVHQHAVLHY